MVVTFSREASHLPSAFHTHTPGQACPDREGCTRFYALLVSHGGCHISGVSVPSVYFEHASASPSTSRPTCISLSAIISISGTLRHRLLAKKHQVTEQCLTNHRQYSNEYREGSGRASHCCCFQAQQPCAGVPGTWLAASR